jgi:hypothetical protein
VFDKESYFFSQKLFSDIQEFINDEYVDEHDEDFYEAFDGSIDEMPMAKCIQAPMCADAMMPCKRETSSATGKSLREYMKQMDRSFQEMLFDLIDESGMTDVECYKKANVDKRIFSKIKSNKNYHPSKQTAVAFAISLQLNLDTTQELLANPKFGKRIASIRKFEDNSRLLPLGYFQCIVLYKSFQWHAL